MKNYVDLAIVTGFGDKGVEELKTELDRSMHLDSSQVIPGTPWHKALQEPEERIAEISQTLEAIGSKQLLLVGHSYGALLALVIACRRKMEGFLKVVLLDGPLRPDVEVKPAALGHHLFYKHYNERVKLAGECEKFLSQHQTGKILTIGTTQDRIVPPEAKILTTNEHNIHLRSMNDFPKIKKIPDRNGSRPGLTLVGPRNSGMGANIHIEIPEMAGHRLTKAKAELYGRIIRIML